MLSSYFQKDVNVLECVDKKTTKILQALWRKSYEKNYSHYAYNLPDIQNILKKKGNFKSSRVQKRKLIYAPAKTPAVHNFFSNRKVHNCDMLPKAVVNTVSVNALKNKFDNWLRKVN